MLMADRDDDRSEPQLLAPAAQAAQDDDELLEGDGHGAATSPDAPTTDAGTEKKAQEQKVKQEKEEPLPPADPVSDREVDAFLRDPSLRRAMINVVRGRVRDADVEDVVQVAMWAVKKAKRLPTGDKECRQYALAIARNKAITWYVRKEQDRPDSLGFDDLRGETCEDPGIQRALHADHLDKIAATVPEKDRPTLVCLGRYLMGESIADMAREMEVEYDTLYKRVTTLKRRVLGAAKAMGGLAVLLVVLMVGLGRQRENNVTAPAPDRQHEPPEPKEPTPGTPEAKVRAATLRDEARTQCAAEQWKKCLWSYDVAATLDADGETPELKAARDEALEEVRKIER